MKLGPLSNDATQQNINVEDQKTEGSSNIARTITGLMAFAKPKRNQEMNSGERDMSGLSSQLDTEPDVLSPISSFSPARGGSVVPTSPEREKEVKYTTLNPLAAKVAKSYLGKTKNKL